MAGHSRHPLAVAWLSGLVTLALASAAHAQAVQRTPERLILQRTDTSGSVQVGGQGDTRRDPRSIELQTAARGVNDCEAPGGQEGRAAASGRTDVSPLPENTMALRLLTSAQVHGGDSLKCGSCLSKLCLAPRKEDLQAQATVTSTAVFDLRLPFDESNAPFALSLAGTAVLSGAQFEYVVKDTAGTRVAAGTTLPARIRLPPVTIDSWTVDVTLTADISAAGSCCSKSAEGQASVYMTVERAPLGTTTQTDAGVVTDRRGTVGLLMLGGRPHCPATLISPTEALTAAPCVKEYELAALDFISPTDSSEPWKGGRNLVTASSPVWSYLSSDRMRNTDPTAPANIAVVHLRRPLSEIPAANRVQAAHLVPGQRLRVVVFNSQEISRAELDVRVTDASEQTVTIRGLGGVEACGMVGSPLFVPGSAADATPLAIVTAVQKDGCLASRLDRSNPWVRGMLK